MSRPVERIIPFLEFIEGKLGKIFDDIYKIPESDNSNVINDLIHSEEFIDFWLDNSDLRFSQALVNQYVIPNYTGFWYYIEEDEILEQLGIESREYLLWGQNYDENMNLLPKTIRKPIKDLTIEHIQAILDGSYTGNKKYLECFKNELKLRENG